MTIDRLEYEWAETGTKTPAPSDEKIQEGWVGGDRPTVEYLNFLFNRVEKKINDLIEEGLNSTYLGTDHKAMLTKKLYGITSESWAFCDDTKNQIDGGDVAFVDLEVFFDEEEPRLMALKAASNANTIEVYDPRTLALVESSGTLTGLNVAGSQTWFAVDFCNDGSYAYVMFRDTQPMNDTWCIQAYSLDDWSVKSGWTATGTALTGVGAVTVTERIAKVIIADGTRIACTCPWNDMTTVPVAVATLLISDGSIDDEGYGDATSALGDAAKGVLASDGTNLYFGFIDTTTGQDLIASATLADLSVSGGAGLPYAQGAGVYGLTSILCPAPDIIIGCWASETKTITIGTSAEPIIDWVESGTGADGETALTRQWPSIISDATIDGMNLWLMGSKRADDTGPDLFAGFWKIPISQFIVDESYGPPLDYNLTFVDCAEVYMASPRNECDAVNGLGNSAIAFDGRDVWMIADCRSGQTLSGLLYRLPRANTR